MSKIITFYSYKGGAGRSLALANVAWILASNGKRVLAIDWDLEAPGLHHYFHPFLLDPGLSSSEGLLEFVTEYALGVLTPGTNAPDWETRSANIQRFAISLNYDFPHGGTLDLVPAGQLDEAYHQRISSFDWRAFYERLGGGAFLEAVKRQMRAAYDYILIDSRTGVSDTSGVCTIQMPDSLAVVFTLHSHSVDGAAAVAASALRQHRDLQVFPIPARVEYAERKRLGTRREAVRRLFDPMLETLSPQEKDRYWADVEIPYVATYAYSEVPAVFAERPGQRNGLLSAFECLTKHLSYGEVVSAAADSEQTRIEILAKYGQQ